MDMNGFLNLYHEHKGEFIGAFAGFVCALCFLLLGIFKTLFVAACVIIGYHAGKMLSVDKDYVRRLLDRILPPGTYR